MSRKLPQGFSFFRSVGWFDDSKGALDAKNKFTPSFKLQTDKEIYRPGDSVTATIEICSPEISKGFTEVEHSSDGIPSLLVDNLTFEIKGIEKLDTQWFATQKPLPGSKQRRGEQLFLDTVVPSMVSKVIISSRGTKTYLVRVELPKILPPSYRGISIRYLYYVRSTLCGRWLVLENGDHNRSTDDLIQLEARAPLQIWVSQKSNNLLNEGQGSLPVAADQLDVYWREKDADSEWVRANENLDGFEEGYDSSRDEVSSVSSYNPNKGNADLRNSISLQSIASRLSNNEFQYAHGARSAFPSYSPLPQVSVAEVMVDPSRGLVSPQMKLDNSSSAPSPSPSPTQKRNSQVSYFSKDDAGSPCASKAVESVTSEGFIRGRSYNIRIDDQILLRFSPRNSDSTYYFGDMIGGTLTFFHGEGARRCLEVSITLETSETINQHFVHPSRRSSPTMTKIQSEHHEVVADLVQTSFLFSIPIDGPMSFSSPKISVQWSLRFEFFTTPKDVDLSRYEHPLLIEQREKGDWVLPISVYAPPLRAQTAQIRNEKPLSLGIFFRT